MKLGFVGLGSMGMAMARNLARAGHELAVYNRTRAKAEELAAAEGVRVAASPAEAAEGAEALITMLAEDAAVRAVMLEEPGGALAALAPGSIHVSMSTISVETSRQLTAVHAERGQRYVAAPVFGRPEAAAAARLSVVAAGPADAVEQTRPVLAALGPGFYHVGEEPAMANAVKIAGNFTIAALLETLGEAYALVAAFGVDPKQFLEVVNDGLFKSPVYQNYGTIIAEERFEPAGFKLKLGLKDARLTLAAADDAVVPMPLASLLHDHFLAALARGDGEKDWAVVGKG